MINISLLLHIRIPVVEAKDPHSTSVDFFKQGHPSEIKIVSALFFSLSQKI